ncbi:hypothetical protein AmaxDRAFT_4553 [Limnospira maxima CS-328]|uniref:Uncharacterized protein n=1 Tax=Limnospira maxima CS-328 TaxID=513049 RepID=B5W703_LIMMA|nr:hypothetical protein [Limnospira maxima]EDZ92716.1 hypothetical protein AmaxDRAFT_4553 [Limnospira maxima CS-328]MDC0840154.1 hypothetical protein [Limnoraphis robusta]
MNNQKLLLKTLSVAVLSISLLGGCTSQPPDRGSSQRPAISPATENANARSAPLNTLEELTQTIQNLESSLKARSYEMDNRGIQGNDISPIPADFPSRWSEFKESWERWETDNQLLNISQISRNIIKTNIDIIDGILELIDSLNGGLNSTLEFADIDIDSLTLSLSDINMELGQIQQSFANQQLTQSPSVSETNPASQQVQEPPSKDTNANNSVPQILATIVVTIIIIVVTLVIIFILIYLYKPGLISPPRRQPQTPNGQPPQSPQTKSSRPPNEYTKITQRLASLEDTLNNMVSNSSQDLKIINDNVLGLYKKGDSASFSLHDIQSSINNSLSRLLPGYFQNYSSSAAIIASLQELKRTLDSIAATANQTPGYNQNLGGVSPQLTSDYERQLATLQNQKQELNDQVTNLDNSNQSLKQQVEDLARQNSNYTQWQTTTSNLQQEVEDLKRKQQQQEEEIASYRKELQVKENQIFNLKIDKSTLESDKAKLESEIESLLNPTPVYEQNQPIKNQLPPEIQKIVNDYNNNDSWSHNVSTVAVDETDEMYNKRRSNTAQPLILNAATKGSYQAVATTGNSSEFWLFPKYSKKMDKAVYDSSGKVLFDCHGNTRNNPLQFNLIRPAKLIKTNASDWTLAEKGEIEII